MSDATTLHVGTDGGTVTFWRSPDNQRPVLVTVDAQTTRRDRERLTASGLLWGGVWAAGDSGTIRIEGRWEPRGGPHQPGDVMRWERID
jgi:hypothetical protein